MGPPWATGFQKLSISGDFFWLLFCVVDKKVAPRRDKRAKTNKAGAKHNIFQHALPDESPLAKTEAVS